MPGEKIGMNLPLVVRPDGMRKDPRIVRPVTLGEVFATASSGSPDVVRTPLWIELTDGERTIHAQVSSVWNADGRILVRAEVEP